MALKLKKVDTIPARTTSKRTLKKPEHKSFRLSKRPIHPAAPLPSAPQLMRDSLRQIWQHKRLFAAILSVFALLYMVFVRGFAGSDLNVIKDAFQEVEGGDGAKTGFGLFVFLLGNASSPQTEAASIYQALLLAIVSLALIWAFRQLHENPNKQIYMRQAYYRGTASFVPFMLVLFVIGLQLLPAMIGSSIYQRVITSGLAASNIEAFAWLVLLSLTLLLSMYLITSSLMALYIVSLPNITPMQALYSARELVRHRRWTVMRKILFLPLVLILLAALIFLPLLLFATVIAEVLFFIFTVICIGVVNAYMYQLYRSLL